MYLIYINPLGRNYKNEFIYEFIFSNKTEIEFGDDWDIAPASSGNLTPPDIKYVKQVETLQNNEIELELVLNSDTFSYSDAVENIVAIAWEKESPDDEKRMVFHYGEEITSIVDKLYARDIIFKK